MTAKYPRSSFLSIFNTTQVLLVVASFCLSPSMSLASIENDCSPIDVRDTMSQSLRAHFEESTDQEGTGLCHSYVAADMLAQIVDQPISPLALATDYSNDKGPIEFTMNAVLNIVEERERTNPEIYWPGLIPNAISAAINQKAVCTTSGVPRNSDFFYSPMGNPNGYGAWWNFSDFISQIKEIQNGNCDETCQKEVSFLFRYYLPHLNPMAAMKYLAQSEKSQKSLMSSLQKLMQSNCQNGNNVEIPQNIQTQMVWNNQPRLTAKQKENAIGSIPQTFFEALNESLNKGKIVGFHYDVTPLLKKQSQGRDYHASAIIARKMINNKCHYLIRNSWGPVEKDIYRTELPYEQNSGSIWIPKDLLKEVSISLVYIK